MIEELTTIPSIIAAQAQSGCVPGWMRARPTAIPMKTPT